MRHYARRLRWFDGIAGSMMLFAFACGGSDGANGSTGGSPGVAGSDGGYLDGSADTGSAVDGSGDTRSVVDAACECGDSTVDGLTDGPPAPGSPCNAGDTCGGPPLGCDYGVSLHGTCRHCGGPNEVCCNSTGLADGTCNGGLTCQRAVDTARHCSAEPTDGG